MSEPAGTIDIKKFRESAAKVIQQRAQPFPKLAAELDKLQQELDALEKTGTDKKAVAEARKNRDAKRKQMEDCVRNLEVQKAITQPIPKPADAKVDMKKLLEPLPKIVQDIIQREGIPLGRHGVLQPNVKFDFKKGEFTEGGATIKWNF
jgi:hypothetical protein